MLNVKLLHQQRLWIGYIDAKAMEYYLIDVRRGRVREAAYEVEESTSFYLHHLHDSDFY
jgi:hypothetical protein